MHKPHVNGLNGIRNGWEKGTAELPPNKFNAFDSLEYLWTRLRRPEAALAKAEFPGECLGLPSSFKIGVLAESSIGLTALLAKLLYASRAGSPIPHVTVPLQHASIEFKSERLYSIDGQPAPNPWGPIGGLHKTSDGHVRLHDSFPNHRAGAKTLLGCGDAVNRQEVAAKILKWKSSDLETVAFDNKLVISALRSYDE